MIDLNIFLPRALICKTQMPTTSMIREKRRFGSARRLRR